jgi:hypothetical protein
LRVPGAFDGFEVAIRAIVGQQVSVAPRARLSAGSRRLRRCDRYPFASLNAVFPTAERVADATPAALRGSACPERALARVIALARAVADGDARACPNADIDSTLERLRALPGVGEWTAQYIAMRALAWPDAFPHTDLGVMKALARKRPAPCARSGRSVAPVARVCGHASVAIPAKGLSMPIYDLYESPQGEILLASTGAGLSGVYFSGQKYFPEREPAWRRDDKNACCARRSRNWPSISPACAGASKSRSTLPARRSSARSGTPSRDVAHGETISYGELARRAGAAGRRARCRGGDRTQSDRHHRAVPSHRGRRWKPDRIRWWLGAKKGVCLRWKPESLRSPASARSLRRVLPALLERLGRLVELRLDLADFVAARGRKAHRVVALRRSSAARREFAAPGARSGSKLRWRA